MNEIKQVWTVVDRIFEGENILLSLDNIEKCLVRAYIVKITPNSIFYTLNAFDAEVYQKGHPIHLYRYTIGDPTFFFETKEDAIIQAEIKLKDYKHRCFELIAHIDRLLSQEKK